MHGVRHDAGLGLSCRRSLARVGLVGSYIGSHIHSICTHVAGSWGKALHRSLVHIAVRMAVHMYCGVGWVWLAALGSGQWRVHRCIGYHAWEYL